MLGKYGKILFSLLLVLALTNILYSPNAYAEKLLNKMGINPLNRALLSFSQMPDNYIISHSEDKLKITIKVPGADFSASVSDLHGQGIIKEAFVHTLDDTLVISVILKEARGYSLKPMPYSKKLALETFQWEQIDKAEDLYRTGLLSLQDKIYESAKQYFSEAAGLGYADAWTQLGIILIREGKIGEAKEALLKAEKAGAKSPELFAALSQAYKYGGEAENAEKNKKLFCNLSGLKNLEFLDSDIEPIEETDSDEPQSLLSEFASDTIMENPKDSIPADSLALDSTAVDSTVIETDTMAVAGKDDSIFGGWLSSIVIYIVFFGGLIGVILVTSYFKWKKQRLHQMKSKSTKKDFNDKLKKAGKNIKPEAVSKKGVSASRAADAYKNTSSAEKKGSEKENVKGKTEAKSQKKLQDKLDDITREISKKRLAGPTQEAARETAIKKESEKPQNPVSAKMQLAMHLQEEQKKMKEKESANFDESGFISDIKKLTEIAQKLGIEHDKTEEKEIPASQMSSDKEALSKLADKFGKELDKGKD